MKAMSLKREAQKSPAEQRGDLDVMSGRYKI